MYTYDGGGGGKNRVQVMIYRTHNGRSSPRVHILYCCTAASLFFIFFILARPTSTRDGEQQQ